MRILSSIITFSLVGCVSSHNRAEQMRLSSVREPSAVAMTTQESGPKCEQVFVTDSQAGQNDPYQLISDWSVFDHRGEIHPYGKVAPIGADEFNDAYIRVRQSPPVGVDRKSFLNLFPDPIFSKPNPGHFASMDEYRKWEMLEPYQNWVKLPPEEVNRSFDAPVRLGIMCNRAHHTIIPVLYKNNVFVAGLFVKYMFKNFPESEERADETWKSFIERVPWLRWDPQLHRYNLELDHSAETLLSTLGSSESSVTVYRGTSRLEVEFTKLIKNVRRAQFETYDLNEITRLIESQVPPEGQPPWSRLSMKLQHAIEASSPNDLGELNKQLMKYFRSFILSNFSGRSIFVTPNREGAVFFQKMKEKHGGVEAAVASYKLKIDDLVKMARGHRIYVGLENEEMGNRGYVEIGFPFEDSIEKITDAFEEGL